MPAKMLPSAAVTGDLLSPTYWLVCGLEWHGDGPTAEAAVAVAPGLIPRDALSRNAHQVVGCADLYARKHGLRVVFFSDLTRMLAGAGTSWSQVGVDWQSALRQLQGGSFPARYLTISEPAHLVICDPAGCILPFAAGAEDWAVDERELVRSAVAAQLARDWPAYMQSALASGRVVLAG